MQLNTGRFGQLEVESDVIIKIPNGIYGFSQYTEYCLVDPNDDTLILWLQCLQNPDLAFPVLEPKIFFPRYKVSLSAAELRELKMSDLTQAAVFSVLTIPADVALMTANLKAPIVISLTHQLAKQVVLQENEYIVSHPMFKELRAHLITIQSNKMPAIQKQSSPCAAISVRDIPIANL